MIRKNVGNKTNLIMYLVLLLTLVMYGGSGSPVDANDVGRDYSFNGSISEEVLRNYLSRSITMSDMLMSMGQPYLEDNINMLVNTGAKLAGRAVLIWGNESQVPSVLSAAEPGISQTHTADSEIIVQAGIFEIITTDVENLPVPDWVFQEFGLPVEERNFDYDAMLPDDLEDVDFYGPGSSVPDISKLETRLWFFYLAASYIDIGIEAIHLGQFSWISSWDPGYVHAASITERIHTYAKAHARRKYVLLDAHVTGMQKDGKLLLDFHASPLRIKEGADSHQGVLQVGFDGAIYGVSLGGLTPSGWETSSLPYLVEFDHGYAYDWPPGECPKQECVWGYDEISWFGLALNESERNDFLRYAWNWVRRNDPAGYVEMPGMRDMQAEGETGIDWYFAHSRDVMAYGYNQEETIKSIWASRQIYLPVVLKNY